MKNNQLDVDDGEEEEDKLIFNGKCLYLEKYVYCLHAINLWAVAFEKFQSF